MTKPVPNPNATVKHAPDTLETLARVLARLLGDQREDRRRLRKMREGDR